MVAPRGAVIVTGAAGGIGQALVSAFEQGGYTVLSVDRSPLDRNLHFLCDLVECNDPQDARFLDVVSSLRLACADRLMAIVHNAAHQVVKPASQLSPIDWSRTWSVNVMAPFWLSMAFEAQLEKNKGCVLAISSIHERLTKPGFVAYAASKAALSGMIRALAVDSGGKVRYNAICPAAIATPMLVDGFAANPEGLRSLESFHPSGRIGRPDEVAAAALFLCSDQAMFINGSCIEMSGGIGARLHDPA